MNTCADCAEESVWVFNDPGALPVAYCEHHLPLWLRPRAINGTLPKVERPETASVAKPVTRATRKKRAHSGD